MGGLSATGLTGQTDLESDAETGYTFVLSLRLTDGARQYSGRAV